MPLLPVSELQAGDALTGICRIHSVRAYGQTVAGGPSFYFVTIQDTRTKMLRTALWHAERVLPVDRQVA